MDTVDIDRLLQTFTRLDQERLALTSTYIDLLLKWNARISLTAVRDPHEIVTRHFGESFFTGEVLRPMKPRSLIDLGSGAGFPGLPIAMLLPETKVTLIESNQRKSTFLKEVIFSLKLKNVSVFSGRGEEYQERSSVVTMRAVERFEKALPIAIGLVEQKGWIALMIGALQFPVAQRLGPGVEWSSPLAVPGGHSRVLMLGTKPIKVE